MLLVFQYVIFFSNFVLKKNQCEQMKLCPIVSPNLVGEFSPDVTEESLEAVEQRFGSVVQLGGFSVPDKCAARDRVAVIVPVRDRELQIPIFLKNIHPFMMRQQIEYQIFMVFQAHGILFNRGALFNVGFTEAMKHNNWDCFIFHDVDTIPMNDRNLYNCPKTNPRHMGVSVEKYNFT